MNKRLFNYTIHCQVFSRIITHVPFIRFIVIEKFPSLVVVEFNLNVLVIRYIIVHLKMCLQMESFALPSSKPFIILGR